MAIMKNRTLVIVQNEDKFKKYVIALNDKYMIALNEATLFELIIRMQEDCV